MSIEENKKWKYIIYITILYLSLTYIKELMVFLDVNSNIINILSNIITYGGIAYLIINLFAMYRLGNKYNTPNKVILGQKDILIPFIIMIILGIGIYIIRLIK